MSARRKSKRNEAPEEVSFASAREDVLSQLSKVREVKKMNADAKGAQRREKQVRKDRAREKESAVVGDVHDERQGAATKAVKRAAPLSLEVLEQAAEERRIQKERSSVKRKQSAEMFVEDLLPSKKSRKTVGMFEIVSSAESQVLGRVPEKIETFLHHHFYGDRVPRMDLNHFRSEVVAFGPAKNFVEGEPS